MIMPPHTTRPSPSKNGNSSMPAMRTGSEMRWTTAMSTSTLDPSSAHRSATSVPTSPLAPPMTATSWPMEHSSMAMNPYTAPWLATDSAAGTVSTFVRRNAPTGRMRSAGMRVER